MHEIKETGFMDYSERDQTESYYDEDDLESLVGEDLTEHVPETLLKRKIKNLYDNKRPF